MVLTGPSTDQGALCTPIEGTKPGQSWSYLFSLELEAGVRWHKDWHFSQFLLPDSPEPPWSLPFQKLDCLAVDWILWNVQDWILWNVQGPFRAFFFCRCQPRADSVIFHQRAPESPGSTWKVGNEGYWEGQESSPLPAQNSQLLMVWFFEFIHCELFSSRNNRTFILELGTASLEETLLIMLSLNGCSWFYL